MLDVLTKSEAVAVLCLLMVDANDSVKLEELESMLHNPFFVEHVLEKIGPHKDFLKRYTGAKAKDGAAALEKKAIDTLKTAFPVFLQKTLAVMTLIAGADDDYDSSEKELMARIATGLSINIADIQPELEKMKEASLNQPSNDSKPEKLAENKSNQKAEPKKDTTKNPPTSEK